MKDPAFLFYTKDFSTGTQDMSCCELGAYLRLLMYQHQHGSIPKDKIRLMRITTIFSEKDFDDIWQVISLKFADTGDNHMVNHRLSQIVEQRSTYLPKKIAAATLAGLISSDKTLNTIQREKIKKSFKINDFCNFSESEIKEKVREWWQKMVNHMVNNLANANANANVNEKEEKGGVGEKEVRKHHFDTHDPNNGQFVKTKTNDVSTLVPHPDDPAGKVQYEIIAMNHGWSWQKLIDVWDTWVASRQSNQEKRFNRTEAYADFRKFCLSYAANDRRYQKPVAVKKKIEYSDEPDDVKADIPESWQI